MFNLSKEENKKLQEVLSQCDLTPVEMEQGVRQKKDCGSDCKGNCGSTCQAACKSTCSALF